MSPLALLLFLIELCKQTSTQHQLATAWNFEEFSQHAQVSLVESLLSILHQEFKNNLAAKAQLRQRRFLLVLSTASARLPHKKQSIRQTANRKKPRCLEASNLDGRATTSFLLSSLTWTIWMILGLTFEVVLPCQPVSIGLHISKSRLT